MTLQTRVAVLRETGLPAPYAVSKPLGIETVTLDPPGPGELLVKMTAAGLCHSDLSVIDGCQSCHDIFDLRAKLPSGQYLTSDRKSVV